MLFGRPSSGCPGGLHAHTHIPLTKKGALKPHKFSQKGNFLHQLLCKQRGIPWGKEKGWTFYSLCVGGSNTYDLVHFMFIQDWPCHPRPAVQPGLALPRQATAGMAPHTANSASFPPQMTFLSSASSKTKLRCNKMEFTSAFSSCCLWNPT